MVVLSHLNYKYHRTSSNLDRFHAFRRQCYFGPKRQEMKPNNILLYLAWSISAVTALEYQNLKWLYKDEEYVVMGCKTSITKSAVFCKKDTAKSYACQCKDIPALGTMMNCLYSESSVNNTKVEKAFKSYCDAAGVNITTTKMRKAYKNATKYLVDTEDIPNFNKSIPIRTPIKYKKKTYINAYKSNKARFDNVRNAMYEGSGMLGFWALIFLFATIFNFASKIIVVGKFFNSKPFNKVRQYLSMPSTFGNKTHTEAWLPFGKRFAFFSGLLPTRIESIIIFIWFVYNVLSLSVGYYYVKNDTIWTGRPAQLGRYVGDKSGIICLYGFQLTFLFAGRNNFLMWATGWKQSTFLTYHKWVSRINMMTLFIHAITMHINTVALHKFQSRILTDWYQWGIASLIAGCIMMTAGAYWIRQRHYEWFLFFHIALAVIFLVGTWIHITDFEYQNFAFAMAGIWCFDRLVRIIRLVIFGVKTASATVISNETIKITIPKWAFWKAAPGQYGYIYFMTSTTFFQSHPFTVVADEDNKITLYVKIKGGITSRIYKQLSKEANQTGSIKVSVEGPYGDSKPLKRYETVLLYAGGNGIPGLYAHARALSKNNESKAIKLYWVIRNWGSLAWFYDELLKLKDTSVRPVIYVTRQTESSFLAISSSDNDSSSKNSGDEKTSSDKGGENQDIEDKIKVLSSFVEFRSGRPDIESVIQKDLKESSGNVAVMTCAHNAMVDHVRYTVSQNLSTAQGRVDYFEELQAW